MKKMVLLTALLVLDAACGSDTPDYGEDDAGMDASEDKDGGGDAGSDSDSDSDSDTDTDSDADGDSDQDAGVCTEIPDFDAGSCEKLMGWGFDGNQCVQYTGCECEPYCGELFEEAVDCIRSCSAAGHCYTAKMKTKTSLKQDSFGPGSSCDEIFVCANTAWTDVVEDMLGELQCSMDLKCFTGMTCTTEIRGEISDNVWDNLCETSLLSSVYEIVCLIYI